jgi:hypothetical protein
MRDEADVRLGAEEGQRPTAGWARGGFGLSVYGDATPTVFLVATPGKRPPAGAVGRWPGGPCRALIPGRGLRPQRSAKGSKPPNPDPAEQ